MKALVGDCLSERWQTAGLINACFLVTLGKLMDLLLGFLISDMGTTAAWQSGVSPLQIPCSLPCFLGALSWAFHLLYFGRLHRIFYQVCRIFFLDHCT